MPRWRPGRGLVIAVFWLFVGALDASQTYFRVTVAGMNHSFWRILGWDEAVWLSWVFFTPLVLLLKRRVPVERRSWRALPVHLAAAGLIAAAHGLIGSGAAWLFDPFSTRMMPVRHRLSLAATATLSSDLLVYGGILAAAYGVDHFLRSREREVRALQLEAQLSELRLTALKLQIQPHFLFNTLHSISGLVRAGQNPEAVGMIAGLSEMLRYTLEQTNQEVPLEEELRLLERYLDIQKIRFGSRLVVRLSIDEGTRSVRVPMLLLQPLAENALRHGIEKSAGPGVLEIVARRRGDRLRLEIRDSGPGLPAGETKNGVGLAVTRERLKTLYGDSQELRLEVASEGGTVASIEVPWADAD